MCLIEFLPYLTELNLWSPKKESNPQPIVYKTIALPIELFGLVRENFRPPSYINYASISSSSVETKRLSLSKLLLAVP
jgi:hypothetical protein